MVLCKAELGTGSTTGEWEVLESGEPTAQQLTSRNSLDNPPCLTSIGKRAHLFKRNRGSLVAQSVKLPTLDFSSGHELIVPKI